MLLINEFCFLSFFLFKNSKVYLYSVLLSFLYKTSALLENFFPHKIRSLTIGNRVTAGVKKLEGIFDLQREENGIVPIPYAKGCRNVHLNHAKLGKLRQY